MLVVFLLQILFGLIHLDILYLVLLIKLVLFELVIAEPWQLANFNIKAL